jgi:hypothetical protein
MSERATNLLVCLCLVIPFSVILMSGAVVMVGIAYKWIKEEFFS